TDIADKSPRKPEHRDREPREPFRGHRCSSYAQCRQANRPSPPTQWLARSLPLLRSSAELTRDTSVPFSLPPRLAAQSRQSPHRFLRDRKSTRLNSSHLVTSYAVFCLKKKSMQQQP